MCLSTGQQNLLIINSNGDMNSSTVIDAPIKQHMKTKYTSLHFPVRLEDE